MVKEKLQEQFDNMLPYYERKFKDLIDNVLARAEILDKSDADNEKIKSVLAEADVILSTNKKLEKFSD